MLQSSAHSSQLSSPWICLVVQLSLSFLLDKLATLQKVFLLYSWQFGYSPKSLIDKSVSSEKWLFYSTISPKLTTVLICLVLCWSQKNWHISIETWQFWSWIPKCMFSNWFLFLLVNLVFNCCLNWLLFSLLRCHVSFVPWNFYLIKTTLSILRYLT